jgi:Right handed beta helix region
VTITKSISIVADGGGPAGIFITSGTAITINQGSAIVNVNLRGLTLDGSGTASAGIAPVSITSGAVNLTITDCFIRHFNGDGIVVGASSTQFLVANTVSADNSGSGLRIIGLTGNVGVVDHFTTRGNKVGISMETRGTLVGIVDNVIVDNASQGLLIAFSRATLAGSVVRGNGVGVQVDSAGTAFSYGDNEINFNTTDVQGTLTPIAKR